MSRISPPGWFIVEKLNEQIIGSNNNTDINIKSVKNDLQNRINNIAMGPTGEPVEYKCVQGVTGVPGATSCVSELLDLMLVKTDNTVNITVAIGTCCRSYWTGQNQR